MWKNTPFEKCLQKTKVPHKLPKKEYLESGKFPVVSQEATLISGYHNEQTHVFNVSKPVVIFGDHTQVLKYVDFDFVVGADGVKILLPIEGVDTKYFYYLLQALMPKGKGYARHYRLLKELNISYPPLAEQQRIVAKLDAAFAEIDTAGKAKQKKIENIQRLSTQKVSDLVSDMLTESHTIKLSDVCLKITKGSSPKWQGVSYVEQPGILFVTSENVGNNELRMDKTKYVADKFNEKDSKSILQKGDVLTNIVGASIGRTAVYDLDGVPSANINQAVCLIRTVERQLNPYFLSYLLNSDFFLNALHSGETSTARANISLSFVSNLEIPLPSLGEQNVFLEKCKEIYVACSELILTSQKQGDLTEKLKSAILAQELQSESTIVRFKETIKAYRDTFHRPLCSLGTYYRPICT